MAGLIAHRPVIQFPEVVVYNATKAVSWADLDLSAIVGARAALCYLKVVKSAVGGVDILSFKTKGETATEAQYGLGSVGADSGQYSHCFVKTNSAGLIEIYSTDAVPTWTVTLRAFIAP